MKRYSKNGMYFLLDFQTYHCSCTCRCDGPYFLEIFSSKYKAPTDAKDNHVRFGFITANHLDGDKISYAKQASEGQLFITFNTVEKQQKVQIKVDNFRSKYVHNVEGFLLYFTNSQINNLSSHFPEIQRGYKSVEIGRVSISFILKYSYFDRLHKAIDLLPGIIVRRLMPDSLSCFTSVDKKETIFSKTVPRPQAHCLHCLHLESSQLDALKVIINCDHSKAPVLVFGSFGSGKTRLLASAVYHILSSSTYDNVLRVLVCAHHQSTADSFVETYFRALRRVGIEMARVIPKLSL